MARGWLGTARVVAASVVALCCEACSGEGADTVAPPPDAGSGGQGGAPCPGSVETWSTVLGGTASALQAITQTADDGTVVAGYLGAAWLVKLDAHGQLVWQKLYGEGAARDYPIYSVRATGTGGIVVAGTTMPTGGGLSAAFLAELDVNGDFVWQQAYDFGGTGANEGRAVGVALDGGMFAAGALSSGFYQTWVMKLDATGAMQWAKTLGAYPDQITPSAIEPTSDGGCVLTGTYQPAIDTHPAWVVKLAADGAVQWQRRYGGGGGSIWPLGDGSTLMGGDDAWLAKLDSSGQVAWQRKLAGAAATDGGTADQYQVKGLRPRSAGGYVAAGMVGRATDSAAWLAVLDETGAIIEQRAYGGGALSGMLYALTATRDCGYALAAFLATEGAWVAKVDTSGDLAGCSLLGAIDIPAESPDDAAMDVTLDVADATVQASAEAATATPGSAVVSTGCP